MFELLEFPRAFKYIPFFPLVSQLIYFVPLLRTLNCALAERARAQRLIIIILLFIGSNDSINGNGKLHASHSVMNNVALQIYVPVETDVALDNLDFIFSRKSRG